MNIYVLIKRTFDTEEKITLHNHQIQEEGAEFVVNPYDEYAIEEAIQVRDQHGGEITVVTVGGEDSERELRTALAMGCDKAVLINVEEDLEESDQSSVAYILSEYLKQQEVDLVLAGNVAIDGGSGQVGPRVAELLGIPCVTTITSLQIDDKNVTVTRDVEGDEETIETTLPLLVTAQQGLNEPRYPSLPGIMKAKKKPLSELELDDLEIEEEEVEPKAKTIEIFLPSQKEEGKILKGETSEQVSELVRLLSRESKVLV